MKARRRGSGIDNCLPVPILVTLFLFALQCGPAFPRLLE